jgi:hypothetical protein|tara:strand:+ start:1445 stop:1765 length:321 start_codon:yes stop_codon:yes gene_type:complete
MVADPTSMAVSLGFKALGKIFGSKGKSRKATPLDSAQASLSAGGFKTSSIGMSQPSTGRSAKSAASAEMYDYYQMVAKAKLVADRLDPEKGTQVGEYGAIKQGSIT